jgi:glycosyltransferase 2 family protein
MKVSATGSAVVSSLARVLSFLEHRNAWLAAAFGTVVMVCFFVLTLDVATVRSAWALVTLRLFLITAALISINGLLDGLWLTTITRGSAPAREAYRVVAWHMLLSSILPARLGDLAWMYFVHTWLKQPAARAVFVTFYHRLQDFMVVSLMLLLSLLVAQDSFGGTTTLAVALVLFAVMVMISLSIGQMLGLLAALLLQIQRRFHRPWLHLGLQQVLRIRVWYRHRLQRDQVVQSFIVIFLRWVTILAALTLVIVSLSPNLSEQDSFFLANAYVYFGILPLQSVGGFGSGEAGLAWMLTHYGVPIAKASAVGLLLRLLINLVHLALWVLVLGVLWLGGRRQGSSV